jgi:hypothetical protein
MRSERPRAANRRASRRLSLRRTSKVECRKGSLGLGRNLTVYPLDLSETGVRLVIKEALELGSEAEVLIQGGGFAAAVKRLGRVVWCLPTPDGHAVGLRFDKPVAYADLQALSTPPRILR